MQTVSALEALLAKPLQSHLDGAPVACLVALVVVVVMAFDAMGHSLVSLQHQWYAIVVAIFVHPLFVSVGLVGMEELRMRSVPFSISPPGMNYS